MFMYVILQQQLQQQQRIGLHRGIGSKAPTGNDQETLCLNWPKFKVTFPSAECTTLKRYKLQPPHQ